MKQQIIILLIAAFFVENLFSQGSLSEFIIEKDNSSQEVFYKSKSCTPNDGVIVFNTTIPNLKFSMPDTPSRLKNTPTFDKNNNCYVLCIQPTDKNIGGITKYSIDITAERYKRAIIDVSKVRATEIQSFTINSKIDLQQQIKAIVQTELAKQENKEGLQNNSNPTSISQNFDEIEFIFVKELGIYIGKYEVTQAQWQSVMGTNPFHNKSPNNPVENISSGYILNFIKKLNNRTGRKYRLPTEAEWVYAAGNKSFKYAGSNYLNEVAWYAQNSDKHTHTVGTKNPNAIGLYDMTGNVCELCRDGELRYKLLGGSFKDNAQDCQLPIGDNGTILENMSAYEDAGFRLVLEN